MGVASGGGALREHGHGANRTSAPSAAWPMGRDGAALPLCAGQAQDAGRTARHSVYGAPKLGIQTLRRKV